MQKTLIIKTGAAGDVVRTTSLLNILQGNIYWVVDEKNKLIFPDNFPGLHILTTSDFLKSNLEQENFDLVLSLQENIALAQAATSMHTAELEGVYMNHEGIVYTPATSGWYDMSLLSKKGNQVANDMKRSNPFPFQYWLFKMIGKEFQNEPYIIYRNVDTKKVRGLVGIEKRGGDTWPNKSWGGYEDLEKRIRDAGYEVKYFRQRENIRDYFEDIATCSCIISGDSLPMHVAMAYQIPCLAVFNCTPPNEIHDYGVLRKIVSPLLHSNLYSRSYDEKVVNSVSVEEVFDAFKKLNLPK